MIDAHTVRDILDYDPDTGIFRWCIRPSHHIKPGDIAGSVNGRGYHIIRYKRKPYSAHRLAWLISTGEWPSGEIDHINGQSADNRLTNLREATRSQNEWNKTHKARGASGIVGVKIGHNGGWYAQIRHRGILIHLGTFRTKDEAKMAYEAAKIRFRGDFAVVSHDNTA